ncbi:MAG TPA: primosomal protein N', partial [Geobacteraceae bacterium]|nr:primosomal protein N' [Geobacteraceae bacterium]
MTEQNSSIIIEVAIPLPLDTTYHYLVPQRLAPLAQTGRRVLVPFGRRKVTGYILGHARTTDGELKEIIEVLDAEPLVTARE